MKENNQKGKPREESPKMGLGEPVVQASAWKQLLSKRWVYPAAYMAAAAIILTLVWAYQGSSDQSLETNPTNVTDNTNVPVNEVGTINAGDEGAVQVIASSEDFIWPVQNASEVTVVKPFYEKEGTPEEHQAALVQYKDTFEPNTGIDLARPDNKPFEVRATLAGKVTRVEQHPILGYIVEITHANNLKTVYESLTDVKVKQDAEVKQGDVIASAGVNEFEKDLGVHVHYGVYEDDEPVNPAKLLPQN